MFFMLFYGILMGCASDTPQTVMTPWTTQITVAHQTALEMNPNVVLIGAVATPMDLDSPLSEVPSLRVSATWITPSGDSISVFFQDTQPHDILDITYGFMEPAPSTSEHAWLKQVAETVQITPANALERTLLQGRAFSSQYPDMLAPGIGLHMSKEVEHALGVPAAWSVLYIAPHPSGSNELRVWVDAQSGAILKVVEDETMYG
jgi:hypothetical protein